MPGPPPALGHTQRTSTAELHVEPEWIDFFEVGPGRVRIEVAVHNRGEAPSTPRELLLDAAPIGAFLAWQPLTPVRLPTILPRRTLTVATEVFRSEPQQDSLPLDILRGAARNAGRLDAIRNLRTLWKRANLERTTPEMWARCLPLDPFELLGRRSPHWAGGVRVRIGQATTSRCSARALRFASGRTNMIAFRVASEPDAYRFELVGPAAQWNARLLDLDGPTGTVVTANTETELAPLTPMALVLDPPSQAQRGDLTIRVERLSTRETETIEVQLNASAPGPGCFLV